jgi:hypothetical protein
MILSILSVKPKNHKESNKDDEVAISAIKMMWNHKQKNIARASTWSTNLIMKKDCKANKENKMDWMMIAMADWIAKTKEYKSAHGNK